MARAGATVDDHDVVAVIVHGRPRSGRVTSMIDEGGKPEVSTSLPLSPARRAEALTKLAAEELDVLVIGGGVVGAGAALDAVTRGLKVGLVEARGYPARPPSRA